MSAIPFENYDYGKVLGACCENVGYVPLPLGVTGPLSIDGVSFHIPMATAEGTLVASRSHGCKVLNAGDGVTTVLTQDAMRCGLAIVEAARAKAWVASPAGYAALKTAFESTSCFACLSRSPARSVSILAARKDDTDLRADEKTQQDAWFAPAPGALADASHGGVAIRVSSSGTGAYAVPAEMIKTVRLAFFR